MPNPEDTIRLHYHDLKLLMENYQNVIKLNTLLLEQQKQIIDCQKELLSNQKVISDRQSSIRDRVNKMLDKAELQADSFKQTLELSQANYSDLESAMHGRFDSTVTKIENSKGAVDSMNLEVVKQHSKITNKLYVALIGSALIILALIGMMVQTWEKFGLLQHVSSMLDKIMVFFKIT